MAIDPLTAFTIETWTYLGISLVIAFIRYGMRWRWLGFPGLNVDDHLMIIASVSTCKEHCSLNLLLNAIISSALY